MAPVRCQTTRFKVYGPPAQGSDWLHSHANTCQLVCEPQLNWVNYCLQVDMTLPDLPLHHEMYARCFPWLGRQKRAKSQENRKVDEKLNYFQSLERIPKGDSSKESPVSHLKPSRYIFCRLSIMGHWSHGGHPACEVSMAPSLASAMVLGDTLLPYWLC